MRQVTAFVVLTLALSRAAWGAAILTGREVAVWRIAGVFVPTLAAVILAACAGRLDRPERPNVAECR